MKKFILTITFAFIYIAIPFIYVNCSGQDLPYVLGETPDFSEEDQLEQCLELDVLISSCVDVLKEYEEALKAQESLVASVAETIESFESCQVEEDVSSPTGAELKYAEEEAEDNEVEETEEGVDVSIDCSVVIDDMITAYQVCSGLNAVDKFDDCYDIEYVIEAAESLCNEADESVSEDFCNSLTV